MAYSYHHQTWCTNSFLPDLSEWCSKWRQVDAVYETRKVMHTLCINNNAIIQFCLVVIVYPINMFYCLPLGVRKNGVRILFRCRNDTADAPYGIAMRVIRVAGGTKRTSQDTWVAENRCLSNPSNRKRLQQRADHQLTAFRIWNVVFILR